MVITEISFQKNKQRVNIYTDGRFFCGALAEVVLSKNLKVGDDVTEEYLDELLVASESKYAFDKAIDYISRRLHSEREIRIKLKQKGFRPLVIDETVKKLKEYNYICDENFTAALVESSKNKSKKEIEYILRGKGVSNELVAAYVSVISEDEELLNAESLAVKHVRGKEINEKTLANLYAFLSRKGFSADIVKKVLYRFKENED